MHSQQLCHDFFRGEGGEEGWHKGRRLSWARWAVVKPWLGVSSRAYNIHVGARTSHLPSTVSQFVPQRAVERAVVDGWLTAEHRCRRRCQSSPSVTRSTTSDSLSVSQTPRYVLARIACTADSARCGLLLLLRGLSVCLCVGHDRKPCKKGRVDRDGVGDGLALAHWNMY